MAQQYGTRNVYNAINSWHKRDVQLRHIFIIILVAGEDNPFFVKVSFCWAISLFRRRNSEESKSIRQLVGMCLFEKEGTLTMPLYLFNTPWKNIYYKVTGHCKLPRDTTAVENREILSKSSQHGPLVVSVGIIGQNQFSVRLSRISFNSFLKLIANGRICSARDKLKSLR